ncbi:hypothetical protein IJT17_02585, partial [bacterium]|nr:hypothetical protein [bacterium]
MRKKRIVSDMEPQPSISELEKAEQMPQAIFVLPAAYRLSLDRKTLEKSGRVQLLSPAKIDNAVTVFAGSRCEFAVWGLFGDALYLLNGNTEQPEYTVECVSKSKSACSAALRLEICDGVWPSKRTEARRGVSFVVEGGRLSSGLDSLDVTVRVALTADPKVSAAAKVTVVRPLELGMLPSGVRIREDRCSLTGDDEYFSKPDIETGDAGSDLKRLPTEYVLPSLDSLYLKPAVFCSNGRYYPVSRRELSVEFKSADGADVFEDNCCFIAAHDKAGSVEAEISLASVPELKYKFSLKVVIPQQIYAYPGKPGVRYSINSKCNAVELYERGHLASKAYVRPEDEIVSLGVGEELWLYTFVRYSDGLLRSVNLDDCQTRFVAVDAQGRCSDCNALRVSYVSIIALRHCPGQIIKILVSIGMDDSKDSGSYETSISLVTVEPVALYPVLHRHATMSVMTERLDLSDDSVVKECTVGVDGWCALDFTARYADGSVRPFSTECLDWPVLVDPDSKMKRRLQTDKKTGEADLTPGSGYYVKFKIQRRLYIDGCRLTKVPAVYSVRISGTQIEAVFKVSVCRIKALHLVRSGLLRPVSFDTSGKPVNRAGQRLQEADILDERELELLPGQGMGLAVLAEYTDGRWGYCRRHIYDMRYTAGVDVVDRGAILVRPVKRTPDLAKV